LAALDDAVRQFAAALSAEDEPAPIAAARCPHQPDYPRPDRAMNCALATRSIASAQGEEVIAPFRHGEQR